MNDILINNIIESDGNYNYAYVVIVVKEELYANAAIVFAESVRKIGSLCDLVIMVDNSISNETIEIIKKFYNKIIKIQCIKINNKSPIQNVILSKLHAFNLTEYKKICIVDVDTVLFSNIDEIIINSKTPTISYLENKINYGFIITEPSKNIFEETIKLIKKNKTELEDIEKPFDFICKKIFKKNHILKIALSGKDYKNTDGIQYKIEKPFLMSSNLSIEFRMKLDHFKIWFSYFMNIINKYPEILKAKFIQEPLDVSKYFLAPVSRFTVNFINYTKKKKEDQIIQIYGKNKYTNMNYYHLDISKEYLGSNINYLNSETINKKIFMEYLNDISKFDFSNLIKYTDFKKITNSIDSNYQLNIFLKNYVKIFPNVFIVLEIDKNTQEEKMREFNDLDLKNNILYKKKFNFEGLVLKNILFNIYQNYTYNQRVLFLQGIKDKLNYVVDISIYETQSQLNNININKNSQLFVLFEKNSKIRAGSIFFNDNTINMYNSQNMLCSFIKTIEKNKMISREFLINNIYFQTLKKWIFSIYSGNEIENIIIIDFDNNNFTIVDNNNHSIGKIKKINGNKIFFISIIFTKGSQYNNILSNKKKIIEYILNPEFYWEIEGIKFVFKKN